MYLVYAEESGSERTVYVLGLCGRKRVSTVCLCACFYVEESGSGQTVYVLGLCGRKRVWTDCSCT